MDKLKMESINIINKNIEKIGALFPNVITEKKDENGKINLGINFELLKQELSSDIVKGEESYDFTWAGKKEAILEGNTPIRKTLRPCIEDSENWEETGNLYIEGDNLDVLKLLQESYLNSIKMIYIDPPYNTGKDFIYKDNFTIDKDEYEKIIGIYDDDENRLFQNSETNGRFHSDWCSMLFPRLKLAQNLLQEDGVVFISIDDNEIDNLKKMCNEIFGEANYVDTLIWKKMYGGKNDSKWFLKYHDYIVVYAKNKNLWFPNLLPRTDKQNDRYKNPDSDPRGPWTSADFTAIGETKSCIYEITTPNGTVITPPSGKRWISNFETYQKLLNDNRLWFGKDGGNVPRVKRFLSEVKGGISQSTFLDFSEVGHSDEANKELKKLLNGAFFDYPKPTRLLKRLIHLGMNKDDIILDFFSGSATTSHAVMQLNAEDGGNRKFIMVQLPESCSEDSEAYKAGYKNICEIGKERIRLAGKSINDEINNNNLLDDVQEIKSPVDVGFRVLKVDSTNMKDIYYAANEYSQSMLEELESNIKEDRTDLDLLYGVLLDWGLPLSLSHKIEQIESVTVHTVADGSLIACFEENISEIVVREIAKRQPLRVVFRDSSFANSSDKINIEEIFKLLAPNTSVKVI